MWLFRRGTSPPDAAGAALPEAGAAGCCASESFDPPATRATTAATLPKKLRRVSIRIENHPLCLRSGSSLNKERVVTQGQVVFNSEPRARLLSRWQCGPGRARDGEELEDEADSHRCDGARGLPLA